MQRFTDLTVWQKSHTLVLEIYRRTASFPDSERYGITSQLRRAAVSITANIVEGSRRDSNPDYARFLNIAQSSLAETEYLLLLSRDLNFLPADSHEALTSSADEVGRMLHALRLRVQQSSGPPERTS